VLKQRQALLAVVLFAYGVRTFVRNYDWVDGLHIWRSAAEVCPGSFKTHKSYAKELYLADPQRNNIDEVIAMAERGRAILEQKPLPLVQQSYGIYADLGAYYVDKAEALARKGATTEQTAPIYRRAIEFLDHATAVEEAATKKLAANLAQQGRSDPRLEGVGDYHIPAALGFAYLRLGAHEQSITAFARTQRLAPQESNAYLGAGLANDALGRATEAAVCLFQALLLDSNNQEIRRALNELYAAHFAASDAVIVSGSQRQLNLQSALVRGQICEAYRRLARNFRVAGQEAMARHTEEMARTDQGCAGSEPAR
jgi:tetratricopeptide (TPR) repeat protein